MKRAVIFLLAMSLLLPMLGMMPVHSQKKVVALDGTFRTLPDGTKLYRVKDVYTTGFAELLRDLKGNLTAWGYEVREINGLTSENLRGADALVVAKLYDPSVNYTSAEISAVAAWFKTGGKFLYAGSDSDFVEPYYAAKVGNFKQDQPNQILAAVGSSLRIEFVSVEDAVGFGGIGAPYRVFANETAGGVNREAWAGTITKGLSRVLFHGPAIVIGFKEGKHVPIDQVLDENTMWLFRTTEKGAIVHNTPTPTKVVAPGQRGRFVLAAAQKVRVDGPYSKVVAAGESIMGDRNSCTAVERGVTLQGMQYVKNVLEWGLTVEQVPIDYMTYAIVAVVVVVAVVSAVVVLRKRKKK